MSIAGLKVLIVEDDPIIQEYVSQLLMSHDAQIVGRAHKASRAFDLLNTLEPDFVICDIHLGAGPSGIDVAEVIHQKYDIPYIFLTSFDDEGTLEQAQMHSPYGYIVKPFHDRTLLSTIKIAISNHQKKSSLQKLNKQTLEAKIGDSLSDQEFDILQQLVEGKSYNQIADQQYVTRDTVKYHASKLYAKCGVSSRAELAAKLI